MLGATTGVVVVRSMVTLITTVPPRSAQGFTGVYLDPFCNKEIGGLKDGLTWYSVPPFNIGSSSSPGTHVSGFINTYWTRVDRFIADCAAGNMVAIMDIAYTEGNTGDIDNWMSGFSPTQFGDIGTSLAGRYASTPNIIWTMGNDYNFAGAPNDNSDPNMASIYTTLRSAGDSHVLAYHPYPESNSLQDFGSGGTAGETPDAYLPTITQYSMVYSYIQMYYGIEYAYTQTSPILTIWGDGTFYAGAITDLGMRQEFWWAASSGARGCNTGSDDIWPWTSTSPAAVTSGAWYTTQAGVAISLISSLPNWWKLIPDTSNQLITGGRGTRTTATTSQGGGRQYASATTDNYISASRVADGCLALIYFSGGTASSTITIDQTKMMSGYTATWVDPTNGSQFSQTPGSTYSAHTARGNNNAGAADWVLVLQG